MANTSTYKFSFSILDKITGPVKKMTGSFLKGSIGASKFQSSIGKVSSPVANIVAKMRGLNRAKIKAFATRRLTKFNRVQKRVQKRLGKMTKGFVHFGRGIRNSLSGLPGMIAGAFAISSIVDFGRSVTGVLVKFERMEAVLTNTLGSNSQAKLVMKDIEQFANKMSLPVDELTQTWIKLANRGVRPGMDEMLKLSDLSKSTGKSFDQLTEAILDAQTGEFERLKEFGIKASKSGDKVAFTFKGVKKEVGFTSDAIKDYLVSLGDLKGVQGATAAIAETTGGKLSALSNQYTLLKLQIADVFLPVITKVIEVSSRVVAKMKDWIGWIRKNREAFVFWAKVGGVVISVLGGIWVAAKVIIGIKAIITTLTVAWGIFNLVVIANPIGLVVAAIAGAILAIGLLINKFVGFKKFMSGLTEFLFNLSPFGWLWKVVEVLFPQFATAFEGAFIQKIKEGIAWVRNLWDAVKSFFGFASGNSATVKVEAETTQSPPKTISNFAKNISSGFGRKIEESKDRISIYGTQKTIVGESESGGVGTGISDGLKGVTGGERNVKNINISIGNLVGKLVVKTEKNGMTNGQLKEEMSRILLSVVNDVNYQ